MKKTEAIKRAAEIVIRMVKEIDESGCHSIPEAHLREVAAALK